MRRSPPFDPPGLPGRRRLAAIGRTRASPVVVLLALTVATTVGVAAVWITA